MTSTSSPLVGFAAALARTPSISGSEQAAVELTASELSRLGFDQVEVDCFGNCVGLIGPEAGQLLLIDGHIDSIPLHSEECWTVDPFGGQILNGRLYGLGVCDQKASIAAAAYGIASAYRNRQHRPAGRVALVASVNEEDVEGAALAPVVERLNPKWAITTEPSGNRLCVGQRGRAKLRVTVVGRASHAGHASQGINAAEGLAALIKAVRELEQPEHAQLGRRDITCIDVASWPYPSVSTVPSRALARFDARFAPGETPATLMEAIRAAASVAWSGWREPPQLQMELENADFTTWTGQRFTVPEFEPAWLTDRGSPLVVKAQAALLAAGLDPTPSYYSFCTNGSFLAGVAGIPTIGFGVGEEHLAHQVDEYVTLASLERAVAGFASLARELLTP